MFGDWKVAIWHKWSAKSPDTMTPDERAAYAKKMAEFVRARQAEEEQRHDDCRKRAATIWAGAKDASPVHPYLIAKQVKPHGIRQSGDSLVVPVRDTGGILTGIQFISPDGSKKFQPGTAVSGCYLSIGRPNGAVLIAEGYATGATLHEATGQAVAVAFNAGNLKPVAEALRERLPDIAMVFCADDDWQTKENPGLVKANAAARAVNGLVAVPVFPGDRGQRDTDFNDLMRLAGREAVSSCVLGAKIPEDAKAKASKDEGAAGAGHKSRRMIASEWMQEPIEDGDPILNDSFDRGDKLTIIGGSKARKSFFTLQMIIAVAAGKTFLGFIVPQPRRILHVQYEIQPHHFHKRLVRMCRAMGIDPADLEDRLQIVNARGEGLVGQAAVDSIKAHADEMKPDWISADPLYKIIDGDENGNGKGGLKETLAMFDVLSRDTGNTAVSYVHHDPKGSSGDKQNTDRGSGGGVLGRDYDMAIILSPHATEKDALVVDLVLRNYPPVEPFTVLWTKYDNGGYCYEMRPDIIPEKKTSRTKAPVTSLDAYLPAAFEIIGEGEIALSEFEEQFKKKTNLSDHRIRDFRAFAEAGGSPYIVTSKNVKEKNKIYLSRGKKE
jgi:phage/plasmid primase-like uncharacterized protein